jgi:hypothetical protein
MKTDMVIFATDLGVTPERQKNKHKQKKKLRSGDTFCGPFELPLH